MKVAKFGGSSLATAEQVQKVCAIVRSDTDRRLVVVSAPGARFSGDIKVTDLLIRLARAWEARAGWEAILEEIVGRYAAIAEACGAPATVVRAIQADLEARLNGAYPSPGYFMDAMKAAGEDNSARLVAECLRVCGVEAHYVNPGDAGMLLSDEAGNARVLPEAYPRLHALRERAGVTIFPGFFGYAPSGQVVTFPRGGSDITGAILAAAVDADVYENFTDVDSVLAANPRVIDDPEPISTLTYREMRELSYSGFSVFHDEALAPVFLKRIPVNIRNTNNPSAPGTFVVGARDIEPGRPVVGIAAMKGFCSVYISKYLMNRQVGFGRRVLQVFEDEGISYEHAPSGIDDMSVILRESLFPVDVESRVVDTLRNQLEADDVSVERGLALIMLVGEGMRHSIGITARAGAAFRRANVNIEIINQGSSEVSMMFGVKNDDMDAAVRALYSEFFPD
ncbi:MAG: aspartate kinase [Rhodothermales bacterium]